MKCQDCERIELSRYEYNKLLKCEERVKELEFAMEETMRKLLTTHMNKIGSAYFTLKKALEKGEG